MEQKILKNSVAVIGCSSRFPGSEDIQHFWKTLKNGENHITEIPADRWSADAFYDEYGDAPGRTYIRHGGFIDGLHEWDNQVFSINDLEADRMDPQQKLALELSFRAIENAGLTKDKLKGTDTSVYMGSMNDDFSKLASYDSSFADSYTATSSSGCIISNRISYIYDLHGPSMTLDTACSSSLVGVHLGSKSILSGESEMAICGGVNVIMYPGATICLGKAKMASTTGQCRAFSDNADGYVRGEGCGVVVLKSAEKAIRDKDRIWGFITTGCNSDGQDAIPMTAPSLKRQKILIEQTVEKADINPASVQYVEMHGPGTPVGDPVETAAVGGVYGKARKENQKDELPIGSVKTNIGHLESTAGIAGLIKVLLMMKHRKLAPSLWCDKESTKIDFEDLHIEVVKHLKKWPCEDSKERLAAVNSFGFGGTNVHVIVQGSSNKLKKELKVKSQPIVCFSGINQKSLEISVNDVLQNIISGDIRHLNSLSQTSICARDQFHFRYAALANSTEELKQELSKVLSSKIGGKALRKNTAYNILFVFCGTGTHWENMGMEFYEHNSVFKSALDKVDKIFKPLTGFAILDCLQGLHNLQQPQYGQPAVAGLQLALSDTWEHYGVLPTAVIGHSLGEVSAAYASKKITLESAVKIICSRLKQLEKAKGGGMLVVGNIKTEEVENFIKEKGLEEKLSIAAFNTSTSCTISGDEGAIDTIQTDLQDAYNSSNIFLRKLPVQTAYHSHYLDPILRDLEDSLPNILGSGNEIIRHYSTVTGQLEQSETILSKSHWVRNARNPVLFQKALSAALIRNGKNLVIEVGPKPDLRSAIKSIASEENCDIILHSSMTLNSCSKTFYTSLGKVFEFGVNLKCDKTLQADDFPRYGLNRKYHFKRPKYSEFVKGVIIRPIFHPFVSIDDDADGTVALARISPYTARFVYDHIFMSKVVIPGALYVESVASACEQHGLLDFSSGESLQISVYFKKGCILQSNKSYVTLKTTLFDITSEESITKKLEFDVSTPDNLHSSGTVKVGLFKNKKSYDLDSIKQRCTIPFKGNHLYDELKKTGFEHGPLLQCVTNGSRSNTEVLASVSINDSDFPAYIIHPAMFDCILQLMAMVPLPKMSGVETVKVPVAVKNVHVFSKPPAQVLVYLHVKGIEDGDLCVDAVVMNAREDVFLIFEGIKTVSVGKNVTLLKDLMYNLTWFNVEAKPSENMEDKVVLFSRFPKKILSQLTKHGMGQHVVPYNNETLNNIIEDKNSLDRYLPDDMSKYGHILYCWGYVSGFDDNIIAENLSNRLGDMCFALIQMILYIQQKYPHVTINIITSHVYDIMEGNPKDERAMITGCWGMSLWGMMRTIMKEIPFQHFRCIDVTALNHPTHVSLLKSIISGELEDIELAITDGKITACYLFPVKQQTYIKSRQVELPSYAKISLYCKQSENSSKYVMAAKGNDAKGPTDKAENPEMMIVTSVFIPSRGLVLPIKTLDNHMPVMSFGGICQYKGMQYHCLKPELASNRILYEKTNTIPLTAFPSKTPCSSLWLTARYFVQRVERNIPKGSTIHVKSMERDKIIAHIVTQLLQHVGFNTDIANQPVSYYVIVASFENDVKELFKDEMFISSTSIHILTWFNRTTAGLKMYSEMFEHSEKNMPVFDITTVEEIFADTDFGRTLDTFRKWLGKINKKQLKELLNQCDDIIIKSIPTTKYCCDEILSNDDSIIEMPVGVNIPVKGNSNNIFRSDSSYLIIGGSKGLGFEIVKHLIAKGARYIGILSRTGITEQNKEILHHLKNKKDFEFIDLVADVTDYDQLASAMKHMTSYRPSFTIRGVFFGVILLDNAIIPNMTLHKFNRVLRPKVIGAWNIYQLFKNVDLDYFVMHSSIASVIGSPGQSNYSAANAFMDAIAIYRKHTKGTGQTICWGALELGVLEDNVEARRKIAKYGMQSLNPKDTMRALDQCLLINSTLVMCTDLNWVLISKGIPEGSTIERLMSKVVQRRAHFVKRQTIKQSKPGTTKDFNKVIIQLLQTILMLDDDEMDLDATMDSLGMDSQQLTVIYSTLVESYGEVAISPLDIPALTVAEFIEKLKDVTGTEEANVGNNDKIEAEEVEEQHDNDNKDAMNEFKTIMDEQLANVKGDEHLKHNNGVIQNGTGPLTNGYTSKVAAERSAQYMMIEGRNVMSYLYDGQYYYDKDDEEVLLQIKKKSTTEYFLVVTNRNDYVTANIALTNIAQCLLTDSDDLDPAITITTNDEQTLTFKSDEPAKLQLCKQAIESILQATNEHINNPKSSNQSENVQTSSKTCVIF